MSRDTMDTFRTYFSTHRERFLEEWKTFLRFESVSADPSCHGQCVECAQWLVSHLKTLGFSAELLATATKPLVYAMLPGDPKKQVVLFYGHYDVQPVDPLNLWESAPFEPELRNGRVYARGAQDNKGQVFYFLKAIEALRATGVALPTIKILLEGEEECGSEALHAGLHGLSEKLKADVLMVCDTGMLAPDSPTVTMGLRGIAHFELRVYGPSVDLHSGMYGGIVLNPLQALTSIVAELHGPDGSVAVPGFYDGVREVSAEDKALANAAPIDVAAMSKVVGTEFHGGEKGFSVVERRGFRPTVEINGIGGGYQGSGSKTVIPTYGFAKLSMRLVAGQDPRTTLDKVVAYLKSRAPNGVRVEARDEKIGGPALLVSTHSPVIKKAREALALAFDRDPIFLWEGASIPIIPLLCEVSGAEPLLVGFGLDEDQIHAPNESFSLRQFEDGFRYVTSFLSRI
jgi:acetylornithine deacetylase/succinyl-diaminopimelate desuccinylase-like protein